MKKLLTTVLALMVTALLLAGCNTVAGFGEDMSHAGHSLSNAASK